MTLSSIESEFSKILLDQASKVNFPSLELDGPLMTVTHPRVIWGRLFHKYNPSIAAEKIIIPGWHYECFSHINLAIASYPEITDKFIGQPWKIHQFFNSSVETAIIDFKELGSVVLSKHELQHQPPSTGVEYHVLPPWINYALSPELWGPNGKWSQFHRRLMTLITEKNLHNGTCLPGFYKLNIQAQKINSYGLKGTLLDNSYLIVLPWCFSLSSLEKLESIISQEF